MKNRNFGTITCVLTMTVLLSMAGGLACAAGSGPMTPEYAAKKENFRKQHEQRISPEKRKAAADALKSERLRVYQAKQAVKHSKPSKFDNK